MRILALVTDAFGGEGGIAQSNRDLLTAFAAADSMDEIIVLPRFQKHTGTILPSKITQQLACSHEILYSLNALMTFLIRGPFDLVFCGHLYMTPLAAVLSCVKRTTFWVHIHGIEAWQAPSRLVRWAVEKACLVTAVSRYTRRKFLNWVDFRPDKTRVLPDTVDDRFRPGPKPEFLIKRYGLEDKKVLLTVGRLSASERYKGQDKVITLLPELIKEHPALVYVIAGDGDDRPRLESLALQLGVKDYVRFAGRVDHEELPDFYRLADLFVMPSIGEGFGIVFLEAMACGIPAIGLDADGSTDPLQEGIVGHVTQEVELLPALKRLLSRPSVDKKDLSDCVIGKFGKEKFRTYLQRCISRLYSLTG